MHLLLGMYLLLLGILFQKFSQGKTDLGWKLNLGVKFQASHSLYKALMFVFVIVVLCFCLFIVVVFPSSFFNFICDTYYK